MRADAKKLVDGLPIPSRQDILGVHEFLGHLVALTTRGTFVFHDGRWKKVEPLPARQAYLDWREARYGE